MSSRDNWKSWILIILLNCSLCFLLCLWACDNPDPTGPAADARITLTTTNDAIPADGVSTTMITANVLNPEGEPAEGPIYWTTTCGSLDKSSDAMTGGVSSVTLTASNYPCTAIVTADAIHAKESIEIVCYSIDAMSISVTALPDTIPADGSSKSTISAYVLDERGLPVPDGTTVEFSTTGGSLSSGSAATAAGRATVTLTSETVPKEATIYATVGDAMGWTKVWFYSTAVGSIVLHANPQSGIPADGASSSIITATVKDVYNNPVEDGTIVFFTTTWGNLSSQQMTTSRGVATVILYSRYSTTSKSALVTAVSGDKSANITVYFTGFTGTPEHTPPPWYTFTPTPTPTSASGTPTPTTTQIPSSPTPTTTRTITPSPTISPSAIPVPDTEIRRLR